MMRCSLYFLLVFILKILLIPFSALPYEEHNFRIWDSRDGLEESHSMFVALGKDNDVIVSGGSVPHFCVLDGYTLKKYPSPHQHPYIQQDAEGFYWSYLTDEKMNVIGLRRMDPLKKEWEAFPISLFEKSGKASNPINLSLIHI